MDRLVTILSATPPFFQNRQLIQLFHKPWSTETSAGVFTTPSRSHRRLCNQKIADFVEGRRKGGWNSPVMFYNNICAVHQARRIFPFVLVLRSQTSGWKGYRVVIIEAGQSTNQSMTQSIIQSINQSMDVRRINRGKQVFKQN